MTAKRFEEACPKLAESQRLDPATGTLLNLAVCHEGEGKTATAWVEFNDALVDARREKRAERVKLAQDHIAKLEPRLPKLTVTVAADARAPGLVVTRNGVALHDAAWGTAAPVDPGLQTIAASAPGRRRWENRVNVAEGEARTVAVPTLEVDPHAAPPPSATTRAEVPAEQDGPAPTSDRGGRRTAAWVVGGAGVALVLVGGFFGVRTLAQKSDSDAHCSRGACDAQGVSASDDAHKSANVANVAVGLGAIALGVSTYLWLTSAPRPASAALRVAPSVGTDRASLTLGGAF